MNSYVLNFVAQDRSGLVAKVSKTLFENGFNIKDSSCTRLSGIFTMILVVEHCENYTETALKKLFSDITVFVFFPDNKEFISKEENHCHITVYGADKPGIVYAISKVLAEENINIIDLQTARNDIYVMIIEVILPSDINSEWEKRIMDAAKLIELEISIRKVETYEEL